MTDIHSAKLYEKAIVKDSELKDNSVIGESSRVYHSIIGKYCQIDRYNLIKDSLIGDYSYTGPFDMIFNCEIGKFSSISYGVTIGPPEHEYKYATTHPFIYENKYNLLDDLDLLRNEKLSKNLIIGNDVWIGCNSTILRGCTIGDGAVIGANSLVNKDVPPYAIVVGNPGRIIKYRFSDEIIDELLKTKWWNWNSEKIKRNSVFFTSQITLEHLKNIE